MNTMTFDVEKSEKTNDRLKAYAVELSKKYGVKAQDNAEGGKDR